MRWHEHWLTLRFRLSDAAQVKVPPFAPRRHADGLWQRTCFEMFVRHGEGEEYTEFNFSPSGQWAVYDFSAPREGMRQRVRSRAPACTWRAGGKAAFFDAALPVAALPDGASDIGLSAVMVEEGSIKSFWALCHHGDSPDFHDPACFTARLPAREAP
ncbi:hypothetical protein A6F65_01716 [Paraurantiacibacter namhicola]|uniref:DOMON-like domain-containing protein n=2 Tax=Paraurantiacibacter namhicola TaxID=645517 RepID=A0A1C7D9N0_9SPHN|nr:hypothetical protein A6F65_01716 [Paraurantiacibacter namhicola]